MVFGLDADFSEEALVNRINADLANDLGNLTQRSLTMVKKFGYGLIPYHEKTRAQGGQLRPPAQKAVSEYIHNFKQLAFHKALMATWELIGLANKFIDSRQPWALAKDPDKEEELKSVLYELIEALALVAGMIHPIMPETSAEMRRQLGLEEGPPTIDIEVIKEQLKPGAPIQQGKSLFPRVEIGGAPAGKKPKTEAAPAQAAAKSPKKQEKKMDEGLLSFDEFKKMDLRIGLVTAAERIPKSDKLLKLTVDIGEQRTIVAGLGKEFEPEDLTGRQVVVVANLAPAKLMGVPSQGMVLAATDEEGLTTLTPARPAKPGSPVS
jgi:methionyl-tRNA synthetase